jgi:anti-sigma factor RsiW
MTCREFIEIFLDDWLDGGLPARRADACDRHAQTCSDCAEYVRRHRQLLKALVVERLAGGACKDLPPELVRQILGAAGLSAGNGTKGAVDS